MSAHDINYHRNHLLASCAFFGLLACSAYWYVQYFVFKSAASGASAIFAAIAMCYLLRRLIRVLNHGVRIEQSELLMALLIVAITISLMCQHVLLTEAIDSEGRPAIAGGQVIFINSLIWLFIGAAIAQFSARKSDLVALVMVVALCAITWTAVLQSEGATTIQYDVLFLNTSLEEEKVTHLHFAYLATILVAFAYAFSKRLGPIIFILGLLAIFPLGSRSALYFGIVSIVLFEVLLGRQKVLRLFITAVVVLAAVLVVTRFEVVDLDADASRRMLVEGGLEEDASAVTRSEVFRASMRLLPQQFLYGDPTLIVDEFDDMGLYVHNILSAWQFYGFVPFFLILVSFAYCARKMLRMRYQVRDVVSDAGSIILINAALGLIASQFVGNKLLWFSLGFWLLGRSLVPQTAVSRTRRGKRRRRRRSGPRTGVNAGSGQAA